MARLSVAQTVQNRRSHTRERQPALAQNHAASSSGLCPCGCASLTPDCSGPGNAPADPTDALAAAEGVSSLRGARAPEQAVSTHTPRPSSIRDSDLHGLPPSPQSGPLKEEPHLAWSLRMLWAADRCPGRCERGPSPS